MVMHMRLVGWNVQPVVMADDGENLTSFPVTQTMIPAAQWAEFKAGGDETGLAQVREKIESPSEESEAT